MADNTDGFGTLMTRRIRAVATDVVHTEIAAAVSDVRTEVVTAVNDAVSDVRQEVVTQVADVRNDVIEAIEAAASGGGITLGKYTEVFTAAPVWIVNHNLGRPVSLRVSGAGGQEIVAEVIYVSDTQARVFFDVPTAGSVSVS